MWDSKKNNYIVVRRINMENTEDNWDEFSDCVRGFMNQGFHLVGGISIDMIGKYGVSIAQAMLKP